MAPLILTLRLDPSSQERFEAERRQYFPPERNHIPAHLTLFHQLPGTDSALSSLAQAARQQPPFPMAVNGLRSLGRGVAYTLVSPPLLSLHARLAEVCAEHIVAQDRQPFRPHVVVQNKVDPEEARSTLARLTQCFTPFTAHALGLDLWLYCDGPWQFQKTFAFSPDQ